MAQQASPKVTGQMDDRRAQLTILSTVVSRTGTSFSFSAMALNQQSSINNQLRQSPIANHQIRIQQSAISNSALVSPIEDALPPDIDVPGQHDQEKQQHLDEPGPAQ